MCFSVCASDLDRVSDEDDEAPEITVSPGQPLLLSCRQKENSPTQWLTDNQGQVGIINLTIFFSRFINLLFTLLKTLPPFPS